MWRARLRAINWWPAAFALALNAFGVAFVYSACYDPDGFLGLDDKHRVAMQAVATLLSLAAAVAVGLVPLARWKAATVPLYVACLVVQAFMMVAAGSPLVPDHKGQHNWLALGPIQVQPSEFIKLGVLLACARFAASSRFDVRRVGDVVALLGIAALPSAVLAKEDLGSALTFPPMAVGILFLAGVRPRHLAAMATGTLALLAAGVWSLSRVKDGPKAYQWHRIQAWLDPEKYALTEAYQTMKAMHSIGSGQWLGEGYLQGSLNRLNDLPEKHTDLIFAVVGEEIGFVGSSLALLALLAFGCTCIACAASCRDAFGRYVIGGFACLVMGQAAINLAVVLGLMPCTGVTLPFVSYGGSSLLATWLGIGLTLSATAARGAQRDQLWR